MEIKELISSMCKYNSGRHMLDSGDYYGRTYERLKDVDLETLPKFKVQLNRYGREDGDEIAVETEVNTYHWLVANAALDDECEEFNELHSESKSYIIEKFATRIDNTYNSDSALSQDFRYCEIKILGNYYTAISIHTGCDIRGGYSPWFLVAGEIGTPYIEVSTDTDTEGDGPYVSIDQHVSNFSVDVNGLGIQIFDVSKFGEDGNYVNSEPVD